MTDLQKWWHDLKLGWHDIRDDPRPLLERWSDYRGARRYLEGPGKPPTKEEAQRARDHLEAREMKAKLDTLRDLALEARVPGLGDGTVRATAIIAVLEGRQRKPTIIRRDTDG